LRFLQRYEILLAMTSRHAEGEGSREKYWATAMALVIIIAVVSLYLLSVRPLQWKLGYNPAAPPTFFTRYCQPYTWLRDHTPLGAPLTAYEDWWVGRQMDGGLLPPPDAFDQ
jgi:hypothetical protein